MSMEVSSQCGLPNTSASESPEAQREHLGLGPPADSEMSTGCASFPSVPGIVPQFTTEELDLQLA